MTASSAQVNAARAYIDDTSGCHRDAAPRSAYLARCYVALSVREWWVDATE
jgi:hypothetical protein